jgi:type 1 glutamine amidotransferase
MKLAIGLVLSLCLAFGAAVPRTRKIVLIAGRKSHGPEEHEYLKTVKLIQVMLDRSPNISRIKTEVYFNGWPEDPKTLDTADTIVVVSDGQDHDESARVPIYTPERMAIMERQMKRGCGFVTIHFSTFVSYEYARQVLEWNGGYYEWDDAIGPVSAIKTLETDVNLGSPEHVISRGVSPFHFRDEFYYKLRFDEGGRVKPILRVPSLSAAPGEQTVAWAVQRADGGRGFGTTTGHFYQNWRNADYRKLMLNAIVWTAGVEVPAGGVQSEFVEDDEVNRVLMSNPIPTLILTGDSDPGHQWRETTPALTAALNSEDPRFQVTVSEDPEVLARPELSRYKLIVLNYVNWNHAELSGAARSNFAKYLNSGGGLAIVHFASAAFSADLPGGAKADWPEFRKICRRVWSEAKSTHDPYETFHITVLDSVHPAARGVPFYQAKDELYGNLEGSAPIHVLATGRAKQTNRDEPVAFVYEYGKGRVFQTVLGHDAAAIRIPGTTQLIRYGSLWAAGQR